MEERRIYTVLLGSNLGDRQKYLQFGRDLLEKKCGRLLAASSIYETTAWGKTDQPEFLNQALLIGSSLEPLDFLNACQEIESACEREREEKWGPRTLDIDILALGQEVIHDERLQVPHPLMQERVFALAPLQDIDPEWRHPVLQKTVSEMLQELSSCSEP